jgi:hypothetical protein
MKVQGDQPVQLVCTYWGSDAGGRVFDILVDGERLVTQTLERNKADHFLDQIYVLPKTMIQGKAKVTVTFQAHPGKTAGGLFAARLLKTK